MLKSYKRLLKIALGILLIAIFTFIYLNRHPEAEEGIYATLSSCIDGDTAKFIIDGNEATVRFLGINAPEIDGEKYGSEAKAFVCNILMNTNNIKLVKDDNSDVKDKYNRFLYWVFVDDELLEIKILAEGYAYVAYIFDNYLYTDFLYDAQNTAKNKKIGIWSE